MSIILLTILSTKNAFSQNGFANNWHFGDGGTLSFATGLPTSSGVSSMFAHEGCVSYSDENGNLLFYSNGIGALSEPGYVWNRYHQVMPNGNLGSLAGNGTPVQSSIVVKIPGTNSQYYLFHIDGAENYGSNYKSASYSIIDMTLDGGLGDVSVKVESLNVPTSYFVCEQVSATKHANEQDYWLVLHEGKQINQTTNKFFIYKITASGIFGPQIQSIGTPTNNNLSTMEFNGQGDKLAFNNEIFDFNKTTGILSNPISISWQGGYQVFSKSGRFLYVSTYNQGIAQYDLLAPNIASSAVMITFFSTQEYAQIQNGPDGKIYVAMGFNSGFQPYLAVINNPEEKGVACNFVSQQISLNGGGTCILGLPNFIDCDMFNQVGLIENEITFFNVYPNPVSDQLTVNSDFECEFVLNNISGQFIQNGKFGSGINYLDLSKVASGIYLLKCQTEGQTQITQIIKD